MENVLESTRIGDNMAPKSPKCQIGKNIFDDSFDNKLDSGISGYDEEYSLAYEGVSLVEDYRLESFKPIPFEITSRMSESHKIFGFLTCINRAYAVINSSLYIWDYSTGHNVVFIEESHNILVVSAFKPRLDEEFCGKYCLVVGTSRMVRLYLISFDDECHFTSMSVYCERNQWSCSLSYSTFNCICCTAKGLVFIADKAGILYQFIYNTHPTFWGTERCRLECVSSSRLSSYIFNVIPFLASPLDCAVELCVDDTRDILYMLFDSGDIQIYDITDGKIVAVTGIDSTSYIRKLNKFGLDNARFGGKISKIECITSSESRNLSLVGVTVIGIRLYFSITIRSSNGRRSLSTCHLCHIRIPPALLRNSTIATCSHYRGCFVMFGFENSTPLLWTYFADENVNISTINERMWVLSDVGIVLALKHQRPLIYIRSDDIMDNILNYHFISSSRFLVMNDKGVIVLRYMKPIDKLMSIIEDPEVFSVKFSFFPAKFKAEDVVAMCMSVAVNSSTTDYFMRNNALNIIQLLCSRKEQSPRDDSIHEYSFVSSLPPDYSNLTLFKSAAYWIMQFIRPIFSRRLARIVQDENLGIIRDQFKSSSARVFSAIGRFFKTNTYSSQLDSSYLESLFESNELSWIRTRAKLILEFCETGLDPLMETYLKYHSGTNEITVYEEAHNLYISAKELLFNLREILGLWHVLCQENIVVMTAFLPNGMKKDLSGHTLNGLVTTQIQYFHHLLRSLLSYKIDNPTDVKHISDKLTQYCPSLHGSHNALCLEAISKLFQAKSVLDEKVRLGLIEDAFIIFNEVPSGVDLNTVNQYIYELGCFARAVPLCSRVARSVDEADVTLDCFMFDISKLDFKTVSIINKRTSCYEELILLLERVRMDYEDFSPEVSLLCADDAKMIFDSMTRQILISKDKMLLFTVYDWLCSIGLYDMLITVDSLYLGEFLRHKNDPKLAPVLVKYYQHTKQLQNAAQVLLGMAEEKESGTELGKRIDLLCRALVCAKSSPPNSNKVEILNYIDGKLKVARGQEIVISELRRNGAVDIADFLVLELVEDDKTLFEEYIIPRDLLQSQLLVMRALGICVRDDIVMAWQVIVEKFYSRYELTGQSDGNEVQMFVIELCSALMPDVAYIPIDFISELLEIFAFSFNLSSSWVVEIFFEIKYPLNLLLESYFELITERNPFIPTRPFGCNRLLSAFIHIIKGFSNVPEIVTDESSINELFVDIHNKIENMVSFLRKMFQPLTVELECIINQLDQFSRDIEPYIENHLVM